MKNIIQIMLLLFLVTGCSKDDDNLAEPISGEPVSDNRKFIEGIDRNVDDIAIGYNDDKKIDNIVVGNRIMYEIEYQDGEVVRIKVHSGAKQGIYYFTYDQTGHINYMILYDFHIDQYLSYETETYNAATNSYNNWLFMDAGGSVNKIVLSGAQTNIEYDSSKKGALWNTNSDIVIHLMMIDHLDLLLWPKYMGRYPAKHLSVPEGAIDIANDYDTQGFIMKSHIDSAANNLDVFYNYIEI